MSGRVLQMSGKEDTVMRTAWLIGRFQPLHAGHHKQIRDALSKYDLVVVLLRDTLPTEKNPFNVGARLNMIFDEFEDEMSANRLRVVSVPDPGGDLTLPYGREVGWKMVEVRLDEETESISATKVRAGEINTDGSALEE